MKDNSRHILIIEDNIAHANIIMRELREDLVDCEFTHLKTGKDAINYFFNKNHKEDKQNYPVPNIIILDLHLPQINGIEILKTIKEDQKLRRVPVIVLSSSVSDKDIDNAYFNYANSYIVKPTDFIRFKQTLKVLSNYWLFCNKFSITNKQI